VLPGSSHAPKQATGPPANSLGSQH